MKNLGALSNQELILFLFRKIIQGEGERFVNPIVKLCFVAVVVSVSVMIISVSVLRGFQQEVQGKAEAFGGHLQIISYDNLNAYETRPILVQDSLMRQIQEISGIRHLQKVNHKPGILKNKQNIMGAILKGIDENFFPDFYTYYLREGIPIEFSKDSLSNRIIISSIMARKLKLKVGDKVWVYFIQQPPQVRRFIVGGIYESGLAVADEKIVLCDYRHIFRLNQWKQGECSAVEIFLSNKKKAAKVISRLNEIIPYTMNILSIEEKYPEIYNWLQLQDINVLIILVLMIAVSGVNVVSAMLIMMIEKTKFIGVMKALGMPNSKMQRLFRLQAMYITLKGLIWGNAIGMGLCWMQHYFRWLRLDPAMYYVDHVPVQFVFHEYLLINIITALLINVLLVLPAMLIGRISPVKAIQYE